eukprot:1334128-Rhodomonas_salina.5
MVSLSPESLIEIFATERHKAGRYREVTEVETKSLHRVGAATRHPTMREQSRRRQKLLGEKGLTQPTPIFSHKCQKLSCMFWKALTITVLALGCWSGPVFAFSQAGTRRTASPQRRAADAAWSFPYLQKGSVYGGSNVTVIGSRFSIGELYTLTFIGSGFSGESFEPCWTGPGRASSDP